MKELTDNYKVTLSLRNLWVIIVMGFLLGGTIATFQMKTDAKIERLYLDNQREHELIMKELSSVNNKQDLFVLKRQVEDVVVFVTKKRDIILGQTNAIGLNETMFREEIRQFLR